MTDWYFQRSSESKIASLGCTARIYWLHLLTTTSPFCFFCPICAAIMMVEDTRMQLDMSSSLPSLEMSLNALSTKPQERSAITTATLEYQWSGQRKHTAKLDAKAKNLSTQHIAKSAVTAEMQFSQFPEYNWKVTTDFQKAPGAQHNEYDLKLWWGENLPEDQRHIQVLAISKQVGEYSQGSKGSSEGRLVIKAPVWDIDFNAFYNAMLDLQVRRSHLLKGRA